MNKTLSKFLFFYPVRLLRGENILKYLRYVRNYEKLNSFKQEKTQWEKLRKMIELAYSSIPYYFDLFYSNRIYPSDINKPEDLLLIPPLTKKLIQTHGDSLKNQEINRDIKRTTSGSMGQPLTFYKDRFATAFMDAVMYNSYAWHRIEIGEPQARFWGMPFSKKERNEAQLKDLLMNRKRLSAFDLSESAMEKYYNQIKRFKPHYFYGYPNLIFEFALFIKKNKKSLSFLNLKGIIGTGEVVVPKKIEEIECIFNCKFINEYGCTEVGVIGFDCPYGNMHLMAHNIYMEVVKNGRQVFDEEGEIYITELNSVSFPFIRYKLNDIGVLSKIRCACGLNLPIIKVINGRVDDYIITPSGQKIHDAILAYTLKKGITAFMAVQTKIDTIKIYVTIDQDFSNNLKNSYISILKEEIDYNMNIEFIVVEQLKREKSGKLRYFRSELGSIP